MEEVHQCLCTHEPSQAWLHAPYHHPGPRLPPLHGHLVSPLTVAPTLAATIPLPPHLQYCLGAHCCHRPSTIAYSWPSNLEWRVEIEFVLLHFQLILRAKYVLLTNFLPISHQSFILLLLEFYTSILTLFMFLKLTF